MYPVQIQLCHIATSWHNGSVFVFCVGECPFKPEATPTSTDACGGVTSCNASCQRLASVAPDVDLRECTL